MPLSEKTATEVQDLTWAMADDMITPKGAKRLESLLLAEVDARKLYVQCMQLQADLYLFFNPKEPKVPNVLLSVTAPASIPVLKNLPKIGPNSAPTTGVQ